MAINNKKLNTEMESQIAKARLGPFWKFLLPCHTNNQRRPEKFNRLVYFIGASFLMPPNIMFFLVHPKLIEYC